MSEIDRILPLDQEIDLIPVQSGLTIGGLVEEEHLRARVTASPVQLSDGNEDTDNDDDTPEDFTLTHIIFTGNAANSQSLQLLVVGGDQPITFTLNDVTGQPVTWTNGANVFSKGEQVFYHWVSPSLLIGYTDGDNSGNFNGAFNDDGTFGEGEDRIVFTLELLNAGNGDWTLQIYDQFDHPLTDDPSTEEQTETAFEDVLSLNLTPTIHATDGNGTPLDFTGNAFAVGVIDDVPVLSDSEPFNFVVDEDDIQTGLSTGTSPNDGNADGSYTGDPANNNPGPAFVSGSIAHLVSVGADEFGHPFEGNAKFTFLALDQTTLATLGFAGLRSKGELLSYAVVDADPNDGFQILQATAGDRTIFELKLFENGDVEFYLYDQVDHDPPYDQDPQGFNSPDNPNYVDNNGHANSTFADQNTDLIDHDDVPAGQSPRLFDINQLNFGALIKAEDYDGDYVVLDGAFTIQIRDDIPKLIHGGKIQLTVDEDDISTVGLTPPANVNPGSLGTSPDDGNGDGSWTGDPANTSGGPAVVFGTLNGVVVQSGADEGLTFGFISEGNLRDYFENLGLRSQDGPLSYDVQGNTLFAFVNAGGPGVIYNAGQDRLVFTFEITNTSTGAFTFSLYDQLDHDPGNGENFGLVDSIPGQLTYIDFGAALIARDYDGDGVVLTDMVQIRIKDDVPVVKSVAPIHAFVDEDDISNSQSQGNSPNDGNAEGSNTAANGAAIVSGSLAGLVESGADENLTFRFVAQNDVRAYLNSLGLRSKGELLSYDLNTPGVIIAFDQTGAGVGGPAFTSYDPPADRQVFRLTLQSDGTWTFELYDQIDHDPPYDTNPIGFVTQDIPNYVDNNGQANTPTADQNTDLIDSDDNPPLPNRPLDVEALDFGRIIEAVDFDGDAVTLDGKFLISIRDDIPKAFLSIDSNDRFLTVDETAGVQGSTDEPAGSAAIFANLANNSQVGSDANMAPQYAADTNLFVTTGSVFGADEGGTARFSLALFGGGTGPLATGLFTSGAGANAAPVERQIYLFLETHNGQTYVVGRFDDNIPPNGVSQTGDPAAFALYIDPVTGTLHVALYVSLEHAAGGGNNNALLLPNNLVNAVYTVTDYDGDVATATVDLGGNVRFLDDGPTPSAAANNLTVIHDETSGNDGPNDSNTDFGALFAAVTQKGNDPHVNNAFEPAIGYAQSTGPIVSVNANVGADNPPTLTYAIDVPGGTNALAGLQTTDGRNIRLFEVNSTLVVGRYEIGGNNDPDGSADEPAAFAIHINPTTGIVTVVQYVSLKHPLGGANHDDAVSIANGALRITVTVTDADGDSDTVQFNVGSKIVFEDDGPSIAAFRIATGAQLLVDETVGENAGETNVGLGRVTVSAAGLFDLTSAFGADGPKDSNNDGVADADAINYALTLQAGASGLTDTLSNQAVVLVNNAGVIEGHAGNAAGPLVFTLSIDANSGDVTLTQYRAVVHGNPNDPDEAATPAVLNPNLIGVTVTVTDGDGDTATATAYLNNVVKFEDDGPSIEIAVNADNAGLLTFQLDESIGTGAGNAPETGSIAPDSDLVGALTAPNNADPFGRVQTAAGVIAGLFTDVTVDAGSDGQKSRSDTYALSLAAAGGASVGLATTFALAQGVQTTLLVTDASGTIANDTIYLFKISDTVIEGRVDIDGNNVFDDANNVALRITLGGGADPVLTVDQIMAIQHGSAATQGNGYDSYDEAATLGIFGDTSGLGGVGVTKTSVLTDGDDDTASSSATVNITSKIAIEDDGPVIVTATSVTLDEDGLPAGNNDNAPGDAPAILASATGTLVINFGSDGPAASELVVTLTSVGTADPDVGPVALTSNGAPVLTSWDHATNTLTGYLTDPGVDPVFTLVVYNNGTYDFTLLAQLDHPSTDSDGNNDGNPEWAYEDDIVLNFTATATDGDNDTHQAVFSVTVDDDEPVAFAPVAMSLDNSAGASDTADLDADQNIDDNVGADRLGTITFANIANGQNSGLMSGGQPIYFYFGSDGTNPSVLTASTVTPAEWNGGAGVDPTAETVFTITLNHNPAGNDTYTVNMVGTVDNGAGVSFENLAGTGNAGNPPFKIIESTSIDNLQVLFTPINDNTVNSDTDDIGVGGQFIDIANPDQGLRVDFGQFTSHDNGGPKSDDGFTINSHQTVNGFRFTIDQVSNGTTADVLLRTYDADEGAANQSPINGTAPGGLHDFTNDTLLSITQVEIYNNLGTLVGTATGSTSFGGIGVTFNGDGTVLVTNLLAQYSVLTRTAAGYDRIEILNAGTSGGTDGKFSLSHLQLETVTTGDPITMHFDLALTDADGDRVVVADALDITLNPVTPPNQAPVLALNSLETTVLHVLDQFQTVAYNNNNGTANWATNWTETGDDNDAAISGSGNGREDDIGIVPDANGGAPAGNHALQLSDWVNGGNTSGDDNAALIQRTVNLTGAVSAVLTFDHRSILNDAGDEVLIQVATAPGGPFTTTLLNLDSSNDNASYQTATFDISAFISATTTIRFVATGGMEEDDFAWIDNVKVEYTTITTTPSTDFTTSYTEGGPAISIAAAGPTITDADDTMMESATITITNAQAGDLLTAGALPAGIAVDGSSTATNILLTGTASLADYQAAIQAITYSSTAADPSNVDRLIQVTVNDGTSNSNTATTTVKVYDSLELALPTTQAQLNGSETLDQAGEAKTFFKAVSTTATGPAQLQLLLNGDYSGFSLENVSVSIDGVTLGTFWAAGITVGSSVGSSGLSAHVTAVSGGVIAAPDSNDITWNLGISITAELFEQVVADGLVSINIDNSIDVNFGFTTFLPDFYGYRLVYAGGASDPIVLDLGTQGVSFTSLSNGVEFDMNADGVAEHTAWMNGEDGLLVMDLDGSGAIENGREVVSPFFDGGGFADSVQALKSLDENGDGLIDLHDAAFDKLSVWIDADRDGVSQEDELHSLADLGIESIDVNADSVNYLLDGQKIFAEGSYKTTSGDTRAYVGVEFDTGAVAVQTELAQIENQQPAV